MVERFVHIEEATGSIPVMPTIKLSMSTKKQKIIPLIFDTYIAVIKNSIGSKLFRNFYAKVDGKKLDIMNNGELSCAFYVSSILVLFSFIKKVHGTVDSTVKDLQQSGWRVIKKPKIGSIIVWEKMDFKKGDSHKHIGFYIGNNQAISNSYKLGYPIKHHLTFNNKRKVELILWNQRNKKFSEK